MFFQKYLFVIITIVCVTYFQVVLRWQMQKVDALPTSIVLKVVFLIKLVLTNMYLLSAYVVSVISTLCWLMAIRTMSLNTAYPLLSLSLISTSVCGSLILKESLRLSQIIGIAFILIGGYLINYVSIQTPNSI